MKNKVVIGIVSVALVLCCAIGGTIAWLVATTDSVVNTFTVGDINITLEETTSDYKMVPGNTIAKDPKVTVVAGSEDCYLFVKVVESANLNSFISYAIADGWDKLEVADSVYYREVSASEMDQAFGVIQSDVVTVNSTVTKSMLNDLTAENYPTLTFTAYAVQKANITAVADAWAKVSNN